MVGLWRPPPNSQKELMREVFDLDHARNEDEIEEGADQEQSAGAKPDDPGHPAAQVKAVKSQNSEPAEQPKKICHKKIFHRQYLGRGHVVISVTARHTRFDVPVECRTFHQSSLSKRVYAPLEVSPITVRLSVILPSSTMASASFRGNFLITRSPSVSSGSASPC